MNGEVVNYSQGRTRDSVVKNGHVDTAGAGKGGTIWESMIDICTTTCKIDS